MGQPSIFKPSKMKCKSVKSRTRQHEQCTRKHTEGSIFCKQHSKQKNQIIFDPESLNPLLSDNDTDPITMEPIYKTVDKKRVLATKGLLFTYVTETSGKQYQRTLFLTTIRDLIRNNINVDPFSNLPFSEELLRRARNELMKAPQSIRKYSQTEEQNLRFNRIIEYFQTIGYIIEPSLISGKSKHFYVQWYNEVHHLWIQFRRENPQIYTFIYPSPTLTHVDYHASRAEVTKHITHNIIEFMSKSSMGIMIIISALAYISDDVSRQYPDLVLS